MAGLLRRIWTGLLSALLLFSFGFACAINARAWLAPLGANHTSLGLETFNSVAGLFACIGGASAAALVARGRIRPPLQ
jgi:hypothetical protein